MEVHFCWTTQIQAHIGNLSHDFFAKIHPFSDFSHLSTGVLRGPKKKIQFRLKMNHPNRHSIIIYKINTHTQSILLSPQQYRCIDILKQFIHFGYKRRHDFFFPLNRTCFPSHCVVFFQYIHWICKYGWSLNITTVLIKIYWDSSILPVHHHVVWCYSYRALLHRSIQKLVNNRSL